MLFNSLHYLIYLPIVVALYFAIPHRWRWLLLLVASYYFYMCWKAEYAVLMMISTGVAYCTGLGLDKFSNPKTRKTLLWTCIAILLTVLFAFKYFNFINASLRAVCARFSLKFEIPFFNVLLPVGISFYTFQKISYVVDVFHRKLKPERHFGIFAVYSCFFPQLVAGPIERAEHLLKQFYEEHRFSADRASSGLRLILWGFFKKIVIADRLSMLVQAVYGDPHRYAGFPLLVATLFFALQIYCDFSGYSDIAIGSARLLGFDLMLNFRQPYFSKSIPEFWRRWHISLSTWFKDYLYIPLGGNRVAKWRWYYNLFITFFISGLWHGANWTFAAWGALHGFYMVADSFVAPLRDRARNAIQSAGVKTAFDWVNVGITFCLVVIAWIPFRANNFGDAAFIFTHIFSDIASWHDLSALALKFRGLGLDPSELIYSVVFAAMVFAYDAIDARKGFWEGIKMQPVLVRWAVYYSILILVLFFAPYNKAQNFIYFQF